jgi:probable F420-dependent oxidoreductase
MRVGLGTPIVLGLPGFTPEWETKAGPDELATIAGVADELGFDHLICSEHVGVPPGTDQMRGTTYWDPLATLSFLAAHTNQIRLTTSVLVLPYHHPVAIAKRYGTLDLISKGRLTLGVGVGSLKEEFELLGAPWQGRGAIVDDTLRALRAIWGQSVASYSGSHHDFANWTIEPHGVQSHLPIWVGGQSRKSLERAVTLGDGWMPFALSGDQLKELLGSVELPTGFDVVLSSGRPLDPTGDPEGTVRRINRAYELGATVCQIKVEATSADHCVEQLRALGELVEIGV